MIKTLTIAGILAISTSSVYARDQIQVTGSSTVLPYATIVALSQSKVGLIVFQVSVAGTEFHLNA